MYDYCYAFSLANNHMFDQGVVGYEDTCRFLSEKKILHFGAGSCLEDACKPLLIERGGEAVALLAYNCYSTNSEMVANKSSAGVAPLIFDRIERDVEKLKARGVINIFVLPHWGVENQLSPTVDQVAFARRLIDLGVTGVVGGHTHTIQAFEKFKNKPIAYSLGNFLFNDFSISAKETYYQNAYNKEGSILEVSLDSSEITFDRKFFKFTNKMIPELCDVGDLKTPVYKTDLLLQQLVSKLKYEKMRPELDIALRYNGAAMQLVYVNPPMDSSFSVTYESTKAKCRRVLMKQLKRFL